MVAAYGVVVTIIMGIIGPIGLALLVKNYNHPYIKFRDAKFLVIQNLGCFATVIIASLYMALRPNFSCYLYYFTTILPYSSVLLPALLRYWEYCVSFHISIVRAQFKVEQQARSSVSLATVSSSTLSGWIVHHRWLTSPRFLNIVFSIGFWIILAPSIPNFVLRDEYDYNKITGGCNVYQAGILIALVMVILGLILSVILAYLTWGSRDAYHVKTEMAALSILWIVIMVIWVPYSMPKFTFQRHLSPSFFITIGLVGTYIVCCIYPLFLVYRHTVSSKVGDSSLADKEYYWFVDQLQNVKFRNALHEFLKLQFCQENLLFYEAVIDWKLISVSDTETREIAAKVLKNNFVEEGALCQVNLSGVIREQIIRDLNVIGPIPATIFDAGLSEVVRMIYTNSLFRFKNSSLFKTAV